MATVERRPALLPARATVVGGGPGGLMAAEVLATAGVQVTVFEHMPSVGRKLLLAGRSGLNLTHSEPLPDLLARYGAAEGRLAPAVRQFGPDDLRAWSAGLGEDTFVGSSGRVFPSSFRATPLLRAWLARLRELGVTVETRARWHGWCRAADGAIDPTRSRFVLGDGSTVEVASDVTVLALGGASWPRVGSDGGWVATLRQTGVQVRELRASNCGVVVEWSPRFLERHAGSPLKNVSVGVLDPAGSDGSRSVRGDAVITARGLEGGPIYSVSAAVRDLIDRDGLATVVIDLLPDLDAAQVAERLARRRAKDSTSTALRRTVGLPPTVVAWLREVRPGPLPTAPEELAALLKAVPVVVDRTMSIDRAISSAGGVELDEVDDTFMLRRLPGVFVVGEMLDWEAPTGGYLLQATFSTAVVAARGAAARLVAHGLLPTYDEVDAGDTLWRFDRRFFDSHWTCIWGRGCQGIETEPAADLARGCCSVGAELDGLDEAMNLAALAATLSPTLFQHHADAFEGGIFRDDQRNATRVVDGACIFLNRPDYPAGAGCALHLAAVAAGESPIDWKPSVCWQLPIKVDWETRNDGVEVATVRGWERRDWGADGSTMAWWCTEEPAAYVGENRVIDSLADELSEIVGAEVYVQLRRSVRGEALPHPAGCANPRPDTTHSVGGETLG